MEISKKLNNKTINYLLTIAFEGGSNYWAGLLAKYNDEPEEFTRNPEIHYEVLDKVYQGGSLAVFDRETAKLLGKMTTKSIKEGIEKMIENDWEHYADARSENFDATTADVFFQYCVMGEVVYG